MLKLFALLVLPAALVAGMVHGVGLLDNDASRPVWVVWDGRAFSNPDQFARWLDARGVRYRAWASRHPVAAARLEGREPPVTESVAGATNARRGQQVTPASAPQETVAVPSGHDDRSLGGTLLLAAFIALAAGLVAVAVSPVPVLSALRAPEFTGEHRLELASVGLSIAIGVAAAQLLSSSQ